MILSVLNSSDLNPVEAKVLIEHIDKLHAVSTTMQGWTLTLVGATILLVVSSSYYRANEVKFRLPYLLFIPAWVFSFLSMYNSHKIAGTLSAAYLQTKGTERQIARLDTMAGLANGYYAWQIKYFQISIVILFIWLIVFLIWWVFTKQSFSK